MLDYMTILLAKYLVAITLSIPGGMILFGLYAICDRIVGKPIEYYTNFVASCFCALFSAGYMIYKLNGYVAEM